MEEEGDDEEEDRGGGHGRSEEEEEEEEEDKDEDDEDEPSGVDSTIMFEEASTLCTLPVHVLYVMFYHGQFLLVCY